jgi:NADH-quinone oxidoreductase subunit J
VSPAAFFVVAALAVASALGVVLNRNPVHAACALVAHLFLLAVFFVGLDAQLVGVLQVIVYAGAVVVLFLFVIMLLNLREQVETFSSPRLVAVALGAGVALAAVVAMGVARSPLGAPPLRDGFGGTERLAERLFTTYLLPFELTSILLLVAIIGAVVLGKKKLP